MRHVAEYIASHADEPLPLARLARQADMSATHLQRTFTQVIGVSPKAYQSAQRLGNSSVVCVKAMPCSMPRLVRVWQHQPGV